MSALTIASTAAHPDADIITAWERRKAAHVELNNLPSSTAPGVCYTPQEQAQFDEIDRCEAIIKGTIATTSAGVEIKIWTGLAHVLGNRDEEIAINAADLDWFMKDETRFDWGERLILSAIASLREMASDSSDWDALALNEGAAT